jgi:hypothetical protein
MVDPAITLLLRAWDVAKAFHGKAPELSLPSALRFSQPFGRLFLLFSVERERACPMTEAPAAQKEKAAISPAALGRQKAANAPRLIPPEQDTAGGLSRAASPR